MTAGLSMVFTRGRSNFDNTDADALRAYRETRVEDRESRIAIFYPRSFDFTALRISAGESGPIKAPR
jgi:hypothetical protein